MTDRGLVPVVGKTLEALLVLLYVASLVATLHGGVVPDYRTAAAAEVSDRTLATTAARIEASVPPPSSGAAVSRRVDLPAAIDGAVYRLRVENRTLVLDHPDPTLSGRLRLSLPRRVATVEGSWSSDERATLRIRGDGSRLRVILA
ncbi:hypothetical protein EI982_09975 [Haloplanus rallus]|uniref:Uncharacterized protein n=1 Tax=Haloplanus rallus TaxID=1816183 RepID=A0A6B9F3U7_9EURY|nr:MULTISPECIES: hypothetical protein [Haloplanus]QGX95095.1 hypothetical protein EI982_09975 [Haloplanus rallus]